MWHREVEEQMQKQVVCGLSINLLAPYHIWRWLPVWPMLTIRADIWWRWEPWGHWWQWGTPAAAATALSSECRSFPLRQNSRWSLLTLGSPLPRYKSWTPRWKGFDKNITTTHLDQLNLTKWFFLAWLISANQLVYMISLNCLWKSVLLHALKCM